MKKKLSKNETHLTEKQMYDFYFYYYYAFCVCVYDTALMFGYRYHSSFRPGRSAIFLQYALCVFPLLFGLVSAQWQ